MANIRSEYIKNLMEDKEALNKTLQDATKETLKSVVEEQVTKSLRSLISEAKDDDYEEEEVEPAETPETDTEDVTVDVEDADDDASEESDVEAEEPADAEGEEDAELWDSLEQFKGEDGEYDLTDMDSEDVVKVLKAMRPEDGVRVVKKDDGTFEFPEDENDVEYILDLVGDLDDEEDMDDAEAEIEVELDESVDECPLEEGEVDLGYTDNYQKDTAMTMDPDDGAKTRKWNAGTPTGNGKRWVGHKGDMSPFKNKVSEEVEECGDEPILEVIMDEDACGPEGCDVPQGGVEEASMTMSNKRIDRENNQEDNGHDRQRRHRNKTGVNPTMNAENEAIVRKANAILKENKQLRSIAEQIKNKLHEACVINSSLGKIIKLVTENTTTRDEKINIVNRFNNVKTVNEGKELFNTISEELKRSHSINNVDNVMNNQLAESKKNMVVETSMYQSQDLHDTLDLMERLNKIK